MSKMKTALLAAMLLPASGLLAGQAHAGPCTGDITELGRKLAQSPSLGPVTTGTLEGAGPGSAPSAAPKPEAPGTAGTSADNKVGGTGATKELNSSVGNLVATSPQDVRLQQEGKPTAAAAAAQGSARSVETTPDRAMKGNQPNDRMSEAKMSLERARSLDQADDPACSAAITRTKQLMGS